MRRLAWGMLLLAACDARLHGPTTHTASDGGSDTGDDDAAPTFEDAPIDAPLLPFGQATKITSAASGALQEDDGSLSSNTLELFFAISGTNGKRLYTATRATAADAFGTATQLSFNVTSSSNETPRLSPDDLTMYFASGRAGNGTLDVYQTTRATIGGAWSTPVVVAVNTTNKDEKWFQTCGTAGYYVMVQNHTGSGTDLVEGTLGGAPATTIASLSSNNNETGTYLSADCKTIYFASDRSGTNTLYTAVRATDADPWPAPTAMPDFGGVGGNQEDPWISPDQRTFVFASDAAGSKDLYIVTR